MQKSPVTLLIVDNKKYITSNGLDNLKKMYEKIVIVTTDREYDSEWCGLNPDIEIVMYVDSVDFSDLFSRYDNITI